MPNELPIVLHIGGPKTGSSALQFDLTWNPVRQSLDRPGVTYEYVAIAGRGELRRGIGLSDLASRFAAFYAFSEPLERFVQFPRGSVAKSMAELRRMRESGVIPILSYETWMYADRSHVESFVDALGAPLEIVAYVRNPVSWLTSSYWQRHEVEALSTDDWIAAFLPYSRWSGYLHTWKSLPATRRLSVRLAEGGIAQDFCRTLACQASATDVRHNVSLPGSFARFLCRHRMPEKPGMAEVKMAWWRWANAIKDSATRIQALGKPPRVFGADHLAGIVAATADATHQLLALCDTETADRIRNDPRWWSPSAGDHGLTDDDAIDVSAAATQADADSFMAVTLHALLAADTAWRRANFTAEERSRQAAHRIEALEHAARVMAFEAQHVRKDLEHRCQHLTSQLQAAERKINKLRRRGCLPRPWLRRSA